MKSNLKSATRNLLALAGAAAVALALLTPAPARGAEAKKGAEHLMHLHDLKTVGDVEVLKTGDALAMACAQCKTIFVTKVITTAKGAEILAAGGRPTRVIGTHACQGCSSRMTLVGHGKDRDAKLIHSCKACGDESAICCATKAGSGPTHGMETK